MPRKRKKTQDPEDAPKVEALDADADEKASPAEDGGALVPLEPERKPEPESKPKPKPKSKPKPAPKPEPAAPPKPKVKLEVFLRIAGPRWDQLAGFKHYAKRNHLGPMSVQEWRAALQAFKTRPVK